MSVNAEEIPRDVPSVNAAHYADLWKYSDSNARRDQRILSQNAGSVLALHQRSRNEKRCGQSKRASLMAVFLVLFLDVFGFGLLIPIMPYYLPTLPGYSAAQDGFLYGLTIGAFLLLFICSFSVLTCSFLFRWL